MQALAVYPGKPNSMHGRVVRRPTVDDVPDGRGVLVRVLRVGVDGTDREIIAADYGAAPPGDEEPTRVLGLIGSRAGRVDDDPPGSLAHHDDGFERRRPR